jgi:hypothetical protein
MARAGVAAARVARSLGRGVASVRVGAGVAACGEAVLAGGGSTVAAIGAGVTGLSVGSACGVDVAIATDCEPRLPTTDKPAPMTKPKMMTPMMIGTNGSERPFGGVRRVRRRGDSCMSWRGSRQEDAMLSANRRGVIQVSIPIDVGTVAETGSCAFALVTPMRVDHLLALAVLEALGARAPQDKRERGIRRTLAEFATGSFVVDVDGRMYDCPDSVVVCCGIARLRFFSTTRERVTAL